MEKRFKIDSLNPVIEIIKKIMLEINTAASAALQLFPICRIIVYVKSAFRPIPGQHQSDNRKQAP